MSVLNKQCRIGPLFKVHTKRLRLAFCEHPLRRRAVPELEKRHLGGGRSLDADQVAAQVAHQWTQNVAHPAAHVFARHTLAQKQVRVRAAADATTAPRGRRGRHADGGG